MSVDAALTGGLPRDDRGAEVFDRRMAEGWLELESGRFQSAACAFESASVVNPKAALPWHGLALAKRELGAKEQAITALNHAVQIDPSAARAHALLGTTLAEVGDRSGAERAFRAAIEYDPELLDTRIQLADLLFLSKSWDEGIHHARAAAELAPNAGYVRAHLGHLLATAGRIDLAREAFEAAIEIDANLPAARAGLANVLARQGQLSEAVRQARVAAELAPLDADVRSTLGYLLLLNGEPDVPPFAPDGGLPIHDTYSFMLEHPQHQSFEGICSQIEYSAHEFSKECYEGSRGEIFHTRDDAYRDWVTYGRREGLPYVPGKNTLLKIVLKVKDEPELLAKWIEYHASIVGYHNLIIVDCGSTNQQHLNILKSYKRKLIVLTYTKYYDSLHAAEQNRDFYEMLARNSKYITVLDADEFVFGYAENTISGRNVLSILSSGEEDVYAGTWFTNSVPPHSVDGVIDWTQPIRFSLQDHHLRSGTFGGKAVMRSSIAVKAKHVGHNLHVKEVISYLRPSSFGKIGILHISELGPDINKSRSVKHLYSKGVIPTDLPDDEVAEFLKVILKNRSASAIVLHYIKIYLSAMEAQEQVDKYFETSILLDYRFETNSKFSEVVDGFDFGVLLDAVREK